LIVFSSALTTELASYVEGHCVAVCYRMMALDKPAEFDGLSITLNPRHDPDSLAFYLAHSFGSIAAWCADLPRVEAMFDDLREAKAVRSDNPNRLERALGPFRDFEARTSEFAVRVLHDIDRHQIVPDYTVFFRADIEAITIFHRTGRAPVWQTFLARWKDEVARGVRRVEPFAPREVPAFSPRRIDLQEVKQGL
jgi:hypothetical protein